jgi:predicted nucleic acid-binding protein
VADRLAFVDTNVLVYAHDASQTTKRPIAQALLEELWADRSGAISSQVLQEFYSVATSRLHPQMTPAAAREVVAVYSAWPVVLIEPVLILTASRLAEVRQLSFWDALIVEAARAIGADRVLTEDLNAGQDIEGIRIENPFRDASASMG